MQRHPEGTDLQIPKRLTRWALWGCITLALAALLLGLGFTLAVMNTTSGRARWHWMQDVAACQQNLEELSGALDRAYSDKGHLPTSLESVYPTYLQSRSNLRCPLDERKGKGTTYRYDPAAGWGGGDRIVVWCQMHPPPPEWNPLMRQWPLPSIPVIRSDGSVALVRQPPVTQPPRSPSRASR